MIRVVFDTNVFVSAILTPKSPPAELLELILEGKLRLIISPQIIEEIERVFGYPKIKKLIKKRELTPSEIEDAFLKIAKVAVVTPGELSVEAVPDDPSDNMVLACALEGHANFIISGDRHLTNLKTYRGIEIVSPARSLKFLKELEIS